MLGILWVDRLTVLLNRHHIHTTKSNRLRQQPAILTTSSDPATTICICMRDKGWMRFEWLIHTWAFKCARIRLGVDTITSGRSASKGLWRGETVRIEPHHLLQSWQIDSYIWLGTDTLAAAARFNTEISSRQYTVNSPICLLTCSANSLVGTSIKALVPDSDDCIADRVYCSRQLMHAADHEWNL